MRYTTFTALLAATALTVAAGSAHAADNGAMTASHSAKSFMTDAIEANYAEINLSNEALQKSANPDVKAYAQHMIDDHTKANDKAMALANEIGVTPPTTASLTARAKGKMVAAMSGSAFDKAYVHEMMSDHQSVIKMYQKESTESDGAVSKFAGDTLPTLEQHLTDVQALSAKVSGK